jgi:hypothetical protein
MAHAPSVAVYVFPATILGPIKIIEKRRNPILTIVKFDSWARWIRVPRVAKERKFIKGRKTIAINILWII